MKSTFKRLVLVSVLSSLIISSLTTATLTAAYASTPGCQIGNGSATFKAAIPQTRSGYSLWLNVSGTKTIDIGTDVDKLDCSRTTYSLASSTPVWVKLPNTYTLNTGVHNLTISSYGSGFSFYKGMLISDTCVPSTDGSNCPTATTTTTTTSTTTSTTTTTASTSTTTTTTKPASFVLTSPSNITSQITSCSSTRCTVKLAWSPSEASFGPVTYGVTVISRGTVWSTSTNIYLYQLRKGRTYTVNIFAQDSRNNISPYRAINLKI
ncbi:MAG: hypothetical protein U0R17_00765 [Acidimicrobiia bacterium]